MRTMVCLKAEPGQLEFLDAIAGLDTGIELGSYGMEGIKSDAEWRSRFERHSALAAKFGGPVALHGPFIGIEYGHIDHLIASAVQRRMDMIFDAAVRLRAFRVVLHSGFKADRELFGLQEDWIERTREYWRREIVRWRDAKIGIVLENEIEKEPSLLVRLVDEIGSPSLGLCLDVGHQHLFGTVPAAEWIEACGPRIRHVHIHDNDRVLDRHWPIGRGTIGFKSLVDALVRHAPEAVLSLETNDTMEGRLQDLRTLREMLPPAG